MYLIVRRKKNVQSNIEVNDIFRGHFKLVVDEKMQLSNKSLCLRLRCRAKPITSPKNTWFQFETITFHIEFGVPGAPNSFVKTKTQTQLENANLVKKKPAKTNAQKKSNAILSVNKKKKKDCREEK